MSETESAERASAIDPGVGAVVIMTFTAMVVGAILVVSRPRTDTKVQSYKVTTSDGDVWVNMRFVTGLGGCAVFESRLSKNRLIVGGDFKAEQEDE